MSDTFNIPAAGTWGDVMPALVLALTNGTAEGRRIAAAELESLARKLDSHNAASAGFRGLLADAASLLEYATNPALPPVDKGQVRATLRDIRAALAQSPAAVLPRDSDIESALAWAKRNGCTLAGRALDSYCNARGLMWGEDYTGLIGFRPV